MDLFGSRHHRRRDAGLLRERFGYARDADGVGAEWMGHRRVRILDGGLNGGRGTDNRVEPLTPGAFAAAPREELQPRTATSSSGSDARGADFRCAQRRRILRRAGAREARRRDSRRHPPGLDCESGRERARSRARGVARAVREAGAASRGRDRSVLPGRLSRGARVLRAQARGLSNACATTGARGANGEIATTCRSSISAASKGAPAPRSSSRRPPLIVFC